MKDYSKMTEGQKLALTLRPFITNSPEPKYVDEVIENIGKAIDKKIASEKATLYPLLKKCESSFVNLICEGRTVFRPIRNQIWEALNTA